MTFIEKWRQKTEAEEKIAQMLSDCIQVGLITLPGLKLDIKSILLDGTRLKITCNDGSLFWVDVKMDAPDIFNGC